MTRNVKPKREIKEFLSSGGSGPLASTFVNMKGVALKEKPTAKQLERQRAIDQEYEQHARVSCDGGSRKVPVRYDE
ncbi:MAG: hypothetical protein JNK21_08780 [Rhodospirillaceae bacterium]|nr:hypothetical protein [Rhodospirillaceae bacterium]